MTTFFAVFGHIILNFLLGWTILSFFSSNRSKAENLVASLLLGFYLETLLIASMLFIGIPIKIAVITIVIGVLVLTFIARHQGKINIPNPPRRTRLSMGRLNWYEWVLLLSITEKLIFGIWILTQTPLFFDDSMAHWSRQGHALFGEVNWSFDPESPVFLGHTAIKNYPLAIPIWRAVTAVLNGSWNDIIARADGIVFFIVIISTVWLTVRRFSQKRWLAALSAFIISALPLQIWHAAAGYSDIAVEAFAVASFAALLRKDWFLAGIFSAGTAWAKNDGLILYMPGLLIMAVLLQLSEQKTANLTLSQKTKRQNIILFLSGGLTLTPWLVFNYIHSLGIDKTSGQFSWHAGALQMFWHRAVIGPSHSIFWAFILVVLLFSSIKLLKDTAGRAMLSCFLFTLLIIVFIFSFTDAFRDIANETAIHRVMLQLYGIAVITAVYGIWLRINTNKFSA
jgi:hypothetical protein